jgi:predicted RNase H-like HicB family nuclease
MSSRAVFPTVVWREDGMYAFWCPELDVASQGSTVEGALNNLKEAIKLYLEDAHVPLEGSSIKGV